MTKRVTMQRTTSYEIISCPTCFVDVVAPDDFLENRRKDCRTFYCLNGHHLSWDETEADRLRKRLTKEERLAASLTHSLDQEKASHAATKGLLTKARNRAANGVCPCCNRSFVQLSRHMRTQHPDFVEDA